MGKLKVVEIPDKAVITFPEGKPVKLDLGCGARRVDGFYGVDIVKTDAVDYQFDILKFPWPIADGSVDFIYSAHFFEHIPAKLRFPFMDECYRVLKDGSQIEIIAPYHTSARAVQDPMHEWPPIAETSFLYYNKGWRVLNKLEHYPVTCDFDYGYGFMFDPDVQARNQEYQFFAAKFYTNAIMDIKVTLTKRPAEKLDPDKT